jgi:hypothetical protein
MIGSATSGAFDVLVVGYISRFLRNLKQTLNAVEDHLHTAGVVVLFADERLLSSDPSSWDQFIREAHEAEAYSRKLSKRVSEGYAAKRRRLGIPGGNGDRSGEDAPGAPRNAGYRMDAGIGGRKCVLTRCPTSASRAIRAAYSGNVLGQARARPSNGLGSTRHSKTTVSSAVDV